MCQGGMIPEIRGGGATHAWCQVYLPGAGWVDCGRTNGVVAEASLGMSVEVVVRRADGVGTEAKS